MSAKKIQEFMDLLIKVQYRSDIQKLQPYIICFPKLGYNKSEAEYLTETILKYIDVVINLSANRGYREQIKICTQWLDPLEQIITSKDICEVFIKRVTQKMFDILIEEDVNSWCVKKELLKTFLNCVQKSPKEIRNKTIQQLPNIYLLKIVDSISTYGDFDFQVTLIEIVFRMYGKGAILSKLSDLLPESEELSHSFANINGDTFDEDVRKFLNILNQNSKKVFSVVCKHVFLGRIKCGEPMENVNGLWVDFNRSEKSVSWYTILSNADLDESDAGWNHILFFVSDVELVQIYRPPKTNEAIVYVKLKEPCLISIKDNVEQMESVDNVKFILSCESDKAKTLLSQVLPTMFKHKLHSNPFKVSLGSKVVYKPLKVSVRKQAKSDSTKSKSDASSFTEQLNPFYGTNDSHSLRDSSVIQSISSSSTKYEVISISDGSMHSNDSSVDLIQKCDDTDNTQYETAEMCRFDHTCKISSAQHGAKKAMARQQGDKVLRDDLFLKDVSHGFQGDIKILSGRCSGTKAKCSQSSVATLTPKETTCKSEELQETEKTTCVSSNVAQPSSSDRYETALEFSQTQSQSLMKSYRESDTASKSLKRNKVSVSKDVETNIFKERSLENVMESRGKDGDKIDLPLSQLKEKKLKRDSKNKAQQISNKENLRTEENPDIPSQDVLPTNKPTLKKVIDDGKCTDMAMNSQEIPNKKVTSDDIGWAEEYPDVLSEKYLLANSKPSIREDILTTAGMDTKRIKKAKQKSRKDVKTVDIESTEENLDVPSLETVPAIGKSTLEKGTVMDDGKYTKISMDSQEKLNKNVVTDDIGWSEEYPDILSQKILPKNSKSTLREDILTSAGMDTKTKKAKQKSRENVITVDIESTEENLYAPNLEVVPAINKSTPNKDIMIDDGKYTELDMDSQEKLNKKVTPDDIRWSEEYPDILNEKVLLAHSGPTLKEDILTSVGMNTKITKEAKRESEKDVITVDIASTEENLDVPNQQVVPAINKPTPKKDTVIDDGKYTELKRDSQEKPNKKVTPDDIGWSEEYPDILNEKILPAHSKPTLREDTLTSARMDTKTTVKAKRLSRDVITVDIESTGENLDVPNQQVMSEISKPTLKKDTVIDDGKYTELEVDSQEKPNKKVITDDIGWSEEYTDILSQKFLPAHSKPTLKEDILTDTARDIKTVKKAKKDVVTVDNESNEENLDAPSLRIVSAIGKSTLKKDTVIDGLTMDSQQIPYKKVETNNIGWSEEYPDVLSEKYLLAHSNPIPKEDILTSTKMDSKTNQKSRNDIITVDTESTQENLDVPNQEDVLAINKPTLTKDTEIDNGKYTELKMNSQEEINKNVATDDMGWSENYSDILSQKVLPPHGKPTLKEDILISAGMNTTTKRAKRKSRKDVISADIESIEENLDVPNQEVVSAIRKPTPKKHTVIDDKKYTKMSLDLPEKPNKKVALDEIWFSKKYSDISSQKFLPVHNKPSLRKDTSVGMDSKTIKKSNRKLRKDVTVDIESIEKNLDVPNQEVVPIVNKPTPKKDTMIDDEKCTEMSLDSQEKSNKKVAKDDIGWSEEYPDILSQKILPEYTKPTLKEDILTTAKMDTKTTETAKQKSREDVITVDIGPTEENLDGSNQEVIPAISKPTEKKDAVIDDGRLREISNKKVTTENLKLIDKNLVVLIRADLLATNKATLKKDYLTNTNFELKYKTTKETQKKKIGIHKKVSSTQSNGEVLSDKEDENGELNNALTVATYETNLEKNQQTSSSRNENNLIEDLYQESVSAIKDVNILEAVEEMKETQSSSGESDVQNKKLHRKKWNVIGSEDADEIVGNSSGGSEQSKTKRRKELSEVANKVYNMENTENDLFEEVNELTQIFNRAKNVAENLEYESQLNASTVENSVQGNDRGLELTHDYETDFNILKRRHDQTTTTLGSRKRRKLYNSNELNCLENLVVEVEDVALKKNAIETVLEVAKSDDEEVIEPSLREQEVSAACLSKKVKHRKVENKFDKSKKLKVLRPHAVLNVSKPNDASHLNTAFAEVLESFRKEMKTNLFDIVQHNTAKASKKAGKKKISKTAKKTDKKNSAKNKKRHDKEHKYERMRAQSMSDLSEASLKLTKHGQCISSETSFELYEKRLPAHAQPSQKINIISDIQIRPKRTLLDDKSRVIKKKTKAMEKPVDVVKDGLPAISKHISNAEICNWIETGSPNYTTKITERRTILKYAYFMLKNALEDPDETEVYKDVQNVCKILKKYV